MSASTPAAYSSFFVSAELKTLAISVLSFITTSLGVPAGANSPSQTLALYPETPASCMVGTSGSCGMRLDVVTAKALSRPAGTCAIALGTPAKLLSTTPATKSLAAPLLPL